MKLLLERLARSRRQDLHVHRAVACLYANRGNIDMRNLAKEVALCERQLRRKLLAWTGYGPKQLGRIVRFQNTAQTLLHPRGVNGADAAIIPPHDNTLPHAPWRHSSEKFVEGSRRFEDNPRPDALGWLYVFFCATTDALRREVSHAILARLSS